MTRALPDAKVMHQPGSYWATIHGYRGLYALPQGVAWVIILFWMWMYSFLIELMLSR
jgi:hypothetical protein